MGNIFDKLNSALDTVEKWARDLLGSSTPEPKPAAPRPAELQVYLTVKGRRYHFDPCCPHIMGSFNSGKVVEMALSKAEAAGYTPCDKCCGGGFDDDL